MRCYPGTEGSAWEGLPDGTEGSNSVSANRSLKSMGYTDVTDRVSVRELLA